MKAINRLRLDVVSSIEPIVVQNVRSETRDNLRIWAKFAHGKYTAEKIVRKSEITEAIRYSSEEAEALFLSEDWSSYFFTP